METDSTQPFLYKLCFTEVTINRGQNIAPAVSSWIQKPREQSRWTPQSCWYAWFLPSSFSETSLAPEVQNLLLHWTACKRKTHSSGDDHFILLKSLLQLLLPEGAEELCCFTSGLLHSYPDCLSEVGQPVLRFFDVSMQTVLQGGASSLQTAEKHTCSQCLSLTKLTVT